MQARPKYILALDVGERRVGVALASDVARLAKPYTTLEQSSHIFEDLEQIIQSEKVETIVIGLPRNMSGQETAQTLAVRNFGKHVKSKLGLPVFWQDESLTSIKAEEELKANKKLVAKVDIDSWAASYILDDFLSTMPDAGVNHA